jgi:glycosidase
MASPSRYDQQVAAALTCLFSLQGIPCVYYGTEQGLAGNGSTDQAVREALWGKPGAFEENGPFYVALRDIARVRAANATLRYGRQYFRPISGDRKTFGLSTTRPGVLSISRILNETEAVIIVNTNTESGVEVSVLVDATLNPAGTHFGTAYSTKAVDRICAVEETPDAMVTGGSTSRGTVHSVRVDLAAGEALILVRQR